MSRIALLLLVVSVTALASTGAAQAQIAGGVQATDLGPGQALGINDRGLIIGTPDAQSPTSAWLYRQGGRIELDTLGGEHTVPRAINQAGLVVGRSQNAQGEWRPFLRHSNGRMMDLGTLGGSQSEAPAINRRGEIVGWSEDGTGRGRAFAWRNGRMEDLGGMQAGAAWRSGSTGSARWWEAPLGTISPRHQCSGRGMGRLSTSRRSSPSSTCRARPPVRWTSTTAARSSVMATGTKASGTGWTPLTVGASPGCRPATHPF